MILNTLFPVFAIIFLGSILSMSGFVRREFFSASDRLVYFIFFPCMLFWKIGTGQPSGNVDPLFFAAVLCAVILVFAASTLYIVIARVPAFQAGTFSQSCYRFNAYIGMAIVLKAIGSEGVLLFAVLIGLLIPVINILCVGILIWHSGTARRTGEKCRYLAQALAKNPLILACLAGIGFSVSGLSLPLFVDNTLALLSEITLPLALVSIGSAFSLKRLGGHLRLSAAAAAFKLLLLPTAGYFFMKSFGINGIPFQTGLVFFCLPASTAIYVLSSQLNSDTELASASVVVSTLLSVFSLSGALVLIHAG